MKSGKYSSIYHYFPMTYEDNEKMRLPGFGNIIFFGMFINCNKLLLQYRI